MLRTLVRLTAAIGEPYGRTSEALKNEMAREWAEALADIPARVLDAVTSDWIKSSDRWPKPANLRTLAEALIEKRVSEASSEFGVHRARIKPSVELRNFTATRSPLRVNPTWSSWLDSISPVVEHSMFASLTMGRFAHEVEGASKFEAEWISEKYGDQLFALFKRHVTFTNLVRR